MVHSIASQHSVVKHYVLQALHVMAKPMVASVSMLKASRSGGLALIMGGLCLAMGQQQPARAAAEFCQTSETGSYLCIHRVFGPRSYRGIVYTVDGAPFVAYVNCYQGGYSNTSITSVACWSYNAVSDKPDAKAAGAKQTDPSQMKLLLTNGKPSSQNLISPEAIQKALPPEMK